MRTPGRHPRATERDLARLADGTLDPARREAVERSVAGSGELQSRLRDQRRAVDAVRAHAGVGAPPALRLRRPVLAVPGRHRPRLLGVGVAGALGALVWALAAIGGGQAGLTVADAATLAARPAIAKVPEPPDDHATLPHLRAAGLPFPYWEDRFGWKATGVRNDDVDGRALTTVFYRNQGRRIAYTIVPGTRLPGAPGAETIRRSGIVVHASTDNRRLIVTWLRRGHTCVLSGTGVRLDTLLELAVWRSHGAVPY
ncbi:MAG TPA: hypothetical protein VMA96_07965 [Solirubrobacteraceae bacterium]|nr:hypothetical protein [Solirubrobacteraceae bacterium]